MRKLIDKIRLNREQREKLLRMARAQKSEQREMLRTKIILLLWEGNDKNEVANQLDINIKTVPSSIIFLNGGVKLTVEDSRVLEAIRILESGGIEILSCGTCLDYFELEDKLAVGSASNMFTIAEKLNDAGNTITL